MDKHKTVGSFLLISILLLSALFTAAGCFKKMNDNVLTIFMGIPDENWEDSTFADFIEEETGIQIEIEYLTGDLYTVVSTMVAGGQYPDMIYAVDATNVVMEAGIAVSMEDYLAAGGENIKKVYGDDLAKARSSQGGDLKYLPWDRGKSDGMTPDSAVYIARRVLEFYAQNNNGVWPVVKTLDQYFKLIEDYKAANPKVTVKDSKGNSIQLDTVGCSFITDVNYDYFFQGAPLRLAGYPNDGNLMVNQTTLNCESVIASDAAYNFFNKINEAYRSGIIPVDVFTKNESTYRSELVQGRVLGTLFLQDWYLGEINGELKSKNPDSMLIPMPVTIEDGIKEQYRLAPEMVTRDGLIVTDRCKDTDRAFELLNFLCTDKAQKKLHWGTEGVTYSVDSKGEFYRTAEQIEYLQSGDNLKKEGLIQRPWPSAKPTDTYADGNIWSANEDPAIIAASMTPVDREVLSHYGISTYTELFNTPVSTLYGQAWDTTMDPASEGALANENARKKMRERHPGLVKAASRTKFLELWESFKNDLAIKNHFKYADATEILIKKRANEWFGKDFAI